jgi:hypothetical protein
MASQAQKDEWAAREPFPCAGKPDHFRVAAIAALAAPNAKVAALAYATRGIPVFPCKRLRMGIWSVV